MPFNFEITIHPKDLQEIVDTLSALPWSTGPIIIRDINNQWVVRDKDEQHITTIEKTIEEPG